jgi:hypothetical protein
MAPRLGTAATSRPDLKGDVKGYARQALLVCVLALLAD